MAMSPTADPQLRGAPSAQHPPQHPPSGAVLKALASERRLQILHWLKDPTSHFPPQEHGDPVDHGACNLFIGEKLGISQPAASRHLKVLVDAELVVATRRKGWTYYRRNESMIDSARQAFQHI